MRVIVGTTFAGMDVCRVVFSEIDSGPRRSVSPTYMRTYLYLVDSHGRRTRLVYRRRCEPPHLCPETGTRRTVKCWRGGRGWLGG